MFDLERSIRDWKRSLRRQEMFEDGMIADLEIHLRDAVDALKKEGIPEEEAFLQAAARVGGGQSLASEYGKVREYRLDRRSPWRPARFMPALLGNYLKVAMRKFRRQKGLFLHQYRRLDHRHDLRGLAVFMGPGRVEL